MKLSGVRVSGQSMSPSAMLLSRVPKVYGSKGCNVGMIRRQFAMSSQVEDMKCVKLSDMLRIGTSGLVLWEGRVGWCMSNG